MTRSSRPAGPTARPWYASRWVRLGGAVLLLAVIGVAAVPFLVPVDRFRPLLVRLLAAGTGRDVQIGALRLYLTPTVHIRASDVRLKNPPDFPPGDAILIRSVDLGIAPRALLARRLEVTHIALGGVRLNLLRDPAGRTNFAFSTPAPRAPARGTAAPAGGTSFLTLDRVGAITVTDGEITVGTLDTRRREATPSLSLSGLTGRIGSINPAAPAWVSKLDITVHLKGARLTAPVLAEPVQFSAGDVVFTGNAGRATFSASLDGMRAEVTAAAPRLNPLSITFTVALPELDIARIRALVTGAAPAGGGVEAGPQASAAQELLASGQVTIDRLVLPPLAATRLTSRLRVYTGAIRVDSYALSAYGGTIRGAAAVNASGPGVPAAVAANVSGVDLGQAVAALSPSARKITGTLQAALTLSTALGRDPAAALKGTGTFAVRNGSFPGVSLGSTLAQMASALQITVPQGPTKFSYFGGDLRIAQRRVYSTSLRLQADDLDGTATGSAGFDRTLDYTGTGTLKTQPAGTPAPGAPPSIGQMLGGLLPGAGGATGVRVPFSLRGTIDDPRFSLAGTPQLLHGPSTQPPQTPPQQPGLPSPQDLFKLFQ